MKEQYPVREWQGLLSWNRNPFLRIFLTRLLSQTEVPKNHFCIVIFFLSFKYLWTKDSQTIPGKSDVASNLNSTTISEKSLNTSFFFSPWTCIIHSPSWTGQTAIKFRTLRKLSQERGSSVWCCSRCIYVSELEVLNTPEVVNPLQIKELPNNPWLQKVSRFEIRWSTITNARGKNPKNKHIRT